MGISKKIYILSIKRKNIFKKLVTFWIFRIILYIGLAQFPKYIQFLVN